MNRLPVSDPAQQIQHNRLPDLSRFKRTDRVKAVRQLVTSVVPYLGLWALMIYLVRHEFPYWLVLLVALVTTGFMVRVFIIFHDCCHRSFFSTPATNAILGYMLGILTLTPYEEWRQAHLKHHGTTGNLDRRGSGDIWTMTVEEYRSSSRWLRLTYRAFRNPLMLLTIAPLFYFFVILRFWHKGASTLQKFSVLFTNVVLLLILGAFYLTIGLYPFFAIQLPITFIGGAIGFWLFYVQHQFEGVYWARQQEWNSTRAALEGSSFYRLPKLLNWVSGNIGYHHIHHIRPLIPNYNLPQCYCEIPEMQAVKSLTLRKSLTSLSLNLWHEQQHKLVSFRSLTKP